MCSSDLPRTNSAIAVGGIAGAAGYVGGWLKAVFLGAKHGNTGKRQFEQAQHEIHALREKNQDLEKVNENLRQDYVAAASRLKDETGQDKAVDSTEAPKEKPVAKEEASTADVPAIAKLKAAEHQGKLAAEHAAEPAMA